MGEEKAAMIHIRCLVAFIILPELCSATTWAYRGHMSIRMIALILYAIASLPVAAQSIPFEVTDPESASIPYHLENVSGLWTAPSGAFEKCYSNDKVRRSG